VPLAAARQAIAESPSLQKLGTKIEGADVKLYCRESWEIIKAAVGRRKRRPKK
jgi:hypothetical protein